MTQASDTPLKKLWHDLVETIESFETGPGFFPGETGFYHLPSGTPMKATTVAKKFARIARLAARADKIASATVLPTEEQPK